ncbi:MAG: hypothetical protein VB118_08060 [Oscillospiraceae bacterium]|nr:hypothetical protein [Oscillospiraceae bacterium]
MKIQILSLSICISLLLLSSCGYKNPSQSTTETNGTAETVNYTEPDKIITTTNDTTQSPLPLSVSKWEKVREEIYKTVGRTVFPDLLYSPAFIVLKPSAGNFSGVMTVSINYEDKTYFAVCNPDDAPRPGMKIYKNRIELDFTGVTDNAPDDCVSFENGKKLCSPDEKRMCVNTVMSYEADGQRIPFDYVSKSGDESSPVYIFWYEDNQHTIGEKIEIRYGGNIVPLCAPTYSERYGQDSFADKLDRAIVPVQIGILNKSGSTKATDTFTGNLHIYAERRSGRGDLSFIIKKKETDSKGLPGITLCSDRIEIDLSDVGYDSFVRQPAPYKQLESCLAYKYTWEFTSIDLINHSSEALKTCIKLKFNGTEIKLSYATTDPLSGRYRVFFEKNVSVSSVMDIEIFTGDYITD